MVKIFIHSLFRTGSTYIFSEFRKHNEFCCYYEPFHEGLLDLNAYRKNNFDDTTYNLMHHPHMRRNYFHEYSNLIDPTTSSVPHFKKAFIADEFCHTGENAPLIQYINSLVAHAKGRTPVFKFNRTAFRTKWFKRNYPNSINIYLLRDPRDTWMSHLSLAQGGNPYFAAACLLWASLNKETRHFSSLADALYLIPYPKSHFDDQQNFYALILDAYSLEEQYVIFYFIWLTAFIENVFYADFVLNMNRLCQDTAYRSMSHDFLGQSGIKAIDFADADIPTYDQFALPPDQMGAIERRVQKIVFQSLGKEKTDGFFKSLKKSDPHYYHLVCEEFISDENMPIYLNTDSPVDKCDKISRIIADQYMSLMGKNQSLHLAFEKYVNDAQKDMAKKDEYATSLEQEIKKLDADAWMEIDALNSSLETSITYCRSLENRLNDIKKTLIYKWFLKNRMR